MPNDLALYPVLRIAPAPVGCGILIAGDRVRFARCTANAIAFRILKAGTTYTVSDCGWDEDAEVLRLRLAEHPGYAFRRTMFDLVA